MNNDRVKTITEYIAQFPPDIALKLNSLRLTISNSAPEASETISYGMPTFRLNGNLVHFAAFKNHIGFYPAPSGINAFKNELSGFKTSKGAIQFPNGQELPLDLIRKIVKYRVQENQTVSLREKK